MSKSASPKTGEAKIGRPTIRTPENAAAICERIANGESLRSICDDDKMPSKVAVLDWLNEDSTFATQYARAREEQADHYADEIIEIADVEKDAAKARNRIDARKWKASKLKPKKYGDKLDLNHSGQVNMLTEEQLDARITELLGKAGAKPAT